MGIVVIGSAFVDIKGFPFDTYIPDGRNAGRVEYVHGGVARNVVEDIANVELRPTYIGLVDDTPLGEDVLKKLKNHKVNCDYVRKVEDGMGTWLALFDNNGDVAGSISHRPDTYLSYPILEKYGDEIFKDCDCRVDYNNQEPFAYLLGWAYECIEQFNQSMNEDRTDRR